MKLKTLQILYLLPQTVSKIYLNERVLIVKTKKLFPHSSVGKQKPFVIFTVHYKSFNLTTCNKVSHSRRRRITTKQKVFCFVERNMKVKRITMCMPIALFLVVLTTLALVKRTCFCFIQINEAKNLKRKSSLKLFLGRTFVCCEGPSGAVV